MAWKYGNGNSSRDRKRSKFTAAQKKAYYSGMGYRVRSMNKQIPFKNQANKESFYAGYKACYEVCKKYPDLLKK